MQTFVAGVNNTIYPQAPQALRFSEPASQQSARRSLDNPQRGSHRSSWIGALVTHIAGKLRRTNGAIRPEMKKVFSRITSTGLP